VRITEELLERKKVAAPVWKTEINVCEGSCSDNTKRSTRRIRQYLAGRGSRLVGIICLRTRSNGSRSFVASDDVVNGEIIIR
jgi:hypothetical protein